MSHLVSHLNSAYITAANRLRGATAPRRIVAYVESYDDILFWRSLLQRFENEQLRFEVILPSRERLGRGKKVALSHRLGPDMIACVDADYDYLLQGATPASAAMLASPYVLHTHAYAIENHQCHAALLQRVCVMAVLNDSFIFDFEQFFSDFSRIVHPLFLWSVWAYRYGQHANFSLADFADIIALRNFSIYHPEQALEALKKRVNRKLNALRHQFPEGRNTIAPLGKSLANLGVVPEKTYLYLRGHDLMDTVAGPVAWAVCERLRRDREAEIRRLAAHATQQQNELAAYQHSCAPIEAMLRKHTLYVETPIFGRIMADAQSLVKRLHRPTSSSPTHEDARASLSNDKPTEVQ